MPTIDARVEPFQTVLWSGYEAECTVQFNAQSVGIGGGPKGTVAETATHVITVFDHWDDISEGQIVVLESEYRAPENMVVIDFAPTPVGVTLYARREDRKMVDPEVNGPPVMVEP